jgi:hypothetical protein
MRSAAGQRNQAQKNSRKRTQTIPSPQVCECVRNADHGRRHRNMAAEAGGVGNLFLRKAGTKARPLQRHF